MIEVEKVTSDAAYGEVVGIRRRVFVEEQGVPAELEVDAHEKDATFFLARDGGRPVGTGRFRVKGPLLKFERIATLAEARGKGDGSALMRRMEAEGAERFPRHLQYMHAQADAVPFYERVGWQKVGPMFREADIEHYVMVKPPRSTTALRELLCLADAELAPGVRAYLQGLLGKS